MAGSVSNVLRSRSSGEHAGRRCARWHGQSLEPVLTTTVERTAHVWTKGDKMDGGYHRANDQGRQPQRALTIAIRPDTPAGDAFREVAHACLAQLVNNAKVLSRYRSIEALHQVRVGLRRFRTALTTFRPFIEDGEYEQIETETKWLASELDAARNIDVFIQESFRCVTPNGADREAFARLGAQLLHAQSDAYQRALAALASARFARLVLTTTNWLEIGAWTGSDEPVIKRLRERRAEQFAQDRLDHMRRQVRRLGRRLAQLDAQGRHRLRIKAKKLRYAAEFFAESFGRTRRRNRFLKTLGNLQDALGRIHDTNVAPQLALQIAGRRSAKAGFAAGLIVAKQRASGARDERAALKAFDKFNVVKPFWS